MITTRNCTVLMTFNEKCFRNQLQSSQLKCTVCTCCIDVSEKTNVPTEQYMCPWKQGPAKCFSLSEDEKCSAQIAVDTVVDLPKKERKGNQPNSSTKTRADCVYSTTKSNTHGYSGSRSVTVHHVNWIYQSK